MAIFNGNEVISITDSLESTCAYCGNKTVIHIFNRIRKYDSKVFNGYRNLYGIGYCSFCGNPSIFDMTRNLWIPQAKPLTKINHLPGDISSLYEEIRNSYSVGALSCTIMASRKMIMHVAVECGADVGKSFLFYVNYLNDNNYLPKHSNEWLDKIRDAGNEQNHEIAPATREDTDRILAFISSLLKIVYELPKSI